MPRDPRYDILFEPVRIGPLTARNRFFQVPHCNGMGCTYPHSMIAMRAMKAEGGWAVVCTEETDFHPSNDMTPIVEGRLWDDTDMAVFARMTDAVHRHGALAGIELNYTGHREANLYSREVPLSVSAHPISGHYPAQARAMSLGDIADFRRWHRAAVSRARRAGFDVVYIYCRPGGSLPGHFLSRRLNRRSDAYGASLTGRTRLFREMLEDAIDEVRGECAVAVRFTVDDLGLEENEAHDIIEMFAEVPDLWDVNIRDWSRDSMPSRFGAEGWQEDIISFVKSLTSKPVVGVGRFTSPDTMVAQVRRGMLDFIGAARPSIADPFLPRKIEEGRAEDIRECIGCNICVSSDFTLVPMRCTQNPTAGEEWRKSWHPEFLPGKTSDATVLVVGAGPAGLECARALGERGYAVTLAEARDELGGRVAGECTMPGLAEWGRVRDYRVYQLSRMANVEVYRQSRLDAAQVLEYGFTHVVLATGALWRSDGLGRAHHEPVPGADATSVCTPDDVLDGRPLGDPVVVYDDDHYYMGGVIAEHLRGRGHEVTLVTPASDVSAWTVNTLERGMIESRLHEIGVRVIEKHALVEIAQSAVSIRHVISGTVRELACAALVPITMRLPVDTLYHELEGSAAALARAGIRTLTRIGDCLAPSTIAAAVYAGHRYARELDAPAPGDIAFKRERVLFAG